MAIVINLFAGPGVGKSTTAARIFAELKLLGVNCEMALEFAKDKVWEESFKTMDDQIYIFGKQFHKIWRLKDKVDVIICDSPLPISIVYDKENSQAFHTLIMEQFNKFTNFNYLLERGSEYQTEGRLQTEEEAKEVDETVKRVLDEQGIKYTTLPIDGAYKRITDEIMRELKYYTRQELTIEND
jgi:adenylate kinase family enzyme